VRTGFGYEGFAGSWRAVEEDSFPGFSGAGEYLRESHRHDNGFLEGFFGFGKTCNIIPGDFGFLADDNAVEVVFDGGLLFVVEDLFTLIVFDVVTHHFEVVEEVIEGGFEGLFIVLAFGLEELDEFLVVGFGVVFGFFHGLEIVFFGGIVELSDLLFHLVLIQFPRLVNVHSKGIL
jgi:hypothetical protein